MSEPTVSSGLRKTALNAVHRAGKGEDGRFRGLGYAGGLLGLVAEHMAVRTGVGVFDVSAHGGHSVSRTGLAGCGAEALHERCIETGQGQAQYSAMLYQNGTLSMTWWCISSRE